MLIFWDRRLAFLATPKAGSTAIKAGRQPLANVALQRPAELKHTALGAYRRHIQPWLQAASGAHFTTVALMREPTGWLQSWYHFRLRDDHEAPAHAMTGIGFADFVRDYAQGRGGPACNRTSRPAAARRLIGSFATRIWEASPISLRTGWITRSACPTERASGGRCLAEGARRTGPACDHETRHPA
ncbi:MAG: hypothetical protein QM682_16730 [Paracoccus sp. (in: a-proteobacteria)]|uniref:hypothetical protein n=1 Tax=Paracoccus sp. TaxID=267 RepID=UPI0039E534E7